MSVKHIADTERKFSRKQVLVWCTMLFVGAGALGLITWSGDGLKTSDIGSDVCSSEGARELVEEFLFAYSTGSSSASLTDRFFAPDDRFQWFYDALTRHGEEATDRSDLDSYFAQQQAGGDNLRLVDFSYGHRDEDNTGHFGMVLSRNEMVLSGKGAIDCASGKIMVWATGPASSTSTTQ